MPFHFSCLAFCFLAFISFASPLSADEIQPFRTGVSVGAEYTAPQLKPGTFEVLVGFKIQGRVGAQDQNLLLPVTVTVGLAPDAQSLWHRVTISGSAFAWGLSDPTFENRIELAPFLYKRDLDLGQKGVFSAYLAGISGAGRGGELDDPITCFNPGADGCDELGLFEEESKGLELTIAAAVQLLGIQAGKLVESEGFETAFSIIRAKLAFGVSTGVPTSDDAGPGRFTFSVFNMDLDVGLLKVDGQVYTSLVYETRHGHRFSLDVGWRASVATEHVREREDGKSVPASHHTVFIQLGAGFSF